MTSERCEEQRSRLSRVPGGPSLEFHLRRLSSLLGIFPLGVLLVGHFVTAATAARGPTAYNALVTAYLGAPELRQAIEIGLVAVPLACHAAIGLAVARSAETNERIYRGARNTAFVLERLSGLIILSYAVVHVALERWTSGIIEWAEQAAMLEGTALAWWQDLPRAPFFAMQAHLRSASYLAFTGVAVVAASWHLANGVWSFCVRWGVVVRERAQRRLARACGILFVVLAGVGLFALVVFARGSA